MNTRRRANAKAEKTEKAGQVLTNTVRAFLAYPEPDGQYTPLALDLAFSEGSVEVVGFERLHDSTYEPVAYEYLQGDLIAHYMAQQLKRSEG